MDLKGILTAKLFLWGSVFILIVSGLVMLSVEYIINNYYLVMRQDNEIYSLWQKLPVVIHTDFYFFNWTNPTDIHNKTIKPKFEEVGPYKFRQTLEKVNITWNSNETVTYRNLRYWYYDSQLENNGNLDEMVTTLNPSVTMATNLARFWNYLARKGLSFAISNTYKAIYITRRVGDYLFDGFDDPFIKMFNAMPLVKNFYSIPDWDKFGWAYKRNGSIDEEGVYNVGTGLNNSTLGQLYSWNYAPQTPYFHGHCGKTHGSGGELYPRNLEKQKFITFFNADVRRTVTFAAVGKKQVHNVEGIVFQAGENLLDNGTIIKENQCFCPDICLPSGVFNVSSARNNAPVFGSLPHFYRADKFFGESIEGMQPDANKHEMALTIEPTTGIPLEADMKVQVNMLLQPIPSVYLYERVQKVMIPVIWVRQHVRVPENLMWKLKLIIFGLTKSQPIGYTLLFVALVLLFYIGYRHYVTFTNEKRRQMMYTDRKREMEENTPLK